MTTRNYTAFVDGSCINNGTSIARAGWGASILHPAGKCLEIAGPLKDDYHPTNQRAELTAAIKALSAIKEPAQVDLHSDSEYVVLGINERMTNWKANGWRTSDKKPVANLDLWQDLDAQLSKHAVTAHWVKAHSGHDGNERAHALASDAATFQKPHKKLILVVEPTSV